MRFFNLFTPARTEIVNKKSANAILSGKTFFHRVLQIRRDFLTTCTQKSTRGKKSQVDTALCGRSERPQNRTDATPCSSDVYNIGTRARRRLADVRLSGRSMVEMLGVLAIVGVLSVGAIAGYSKAMLKYKLNKQAEQLNTLISTAERYRFSFNTPQNVTSYLISLGEVPAEMIKTTTNYVYDIFKIAYSFNDEGEDFTLYIRPELLHKNSQQLDICRNIVNTVKAHSDSFYWFVGLGNYGQENSSTAGFLGDDYCHLYRASSKCFKAATLDDVETFCNKHINQNSMHLKIVWHIRPAT